MRKFIVTMVSAVCLMTSCVNGKNIEKTVDYDVQDFSMIKMEGVGQIIYTQDDHCSVRVEGDSDLISRTSVDVQNGILTIVQDGKTKKNKDVTIYISSPTLTKVENLGVGSFVAKEPIKFDDDFTLTMEGVGSIKIADLTCKNLTIHQDGVGSSDVKTQCHNAYYHSEGVGASDLTIEADSLKLISEGVGASKVKGHVKHYSKQSGGIVSKISDKNLVVGE